MCDLSAREPLKRETAGLLGGRHWGGWTSQMERQGPGWLSASGAGSREAAEGRRSLGGALLCPLGQRGLPSLLCCSQARGGSEAAESSLWTEKGVDSAPAPSLPRGAPRWLLWRPPGTGRGAWPAAHRRGTWWGPCWGSRVGYPGPRGGGVRKGHMWGVSWSQGLGAPDLGWL